MGRVGGLWGEEGEVGGVRGVGGWSGVCALVWFSQSNKLDGNALNVLFEDIPLLQFVYLAFTRKPG